MSEQRTAQIGLLIAVCIVGFFGVVFLLSLFATQIVFYVLPFTLLSIVFGLLLSIPQWMKGVYEFENGFRLKEFYCSRQTEGATLSIFVGLCLFVVFLFHLNSDGRVSIPYRNATQGHVDWPGLNQAVNNFNREHFEDSNFKSLRPYARESQDYDRENLEWVFWIALLLSGPIISRFVARGKVERDFLAIQEQLNQSLQSQRNHFDQEKQEIYRRTKQQIQPVENDAYQIKNKNHELVNRMAELYDFIEAQKPVNQTKKQQQFKDDIETSHTEPTSKKSALESDDF